MNQTAKLDYLINYLLAENPAYRSVAVPDGEGEKRRLLRSLMNLRPPVEISGEFLAVQDDYLRAETAAKGVAEPRSLTERENGVYLWKGDITLLAADGIVNAANSKMLGCFVPCHGCVDNAIHSAAGVQLRLKCREIMEEQGHDEQAGGVKITPAYNLPSKYVLHTVGPVVSGVPSGMDERLLRSCYVSCMDKAAEYNLKTLAFCCVSTGEFGFPRQRAAEIAVDTVRRYRENKANAPEVIFDVFGQEDYDIYDRLLGGR